jgi:hypothetical protein
MDGWKNCFLLCFAFPFTCYSLLQVRRQFCSPTMHARSTLNTALPPSPCTCLPGNIHVGWHLQWITIVYKPQPQPNTPHLLPNKTDGETPKTFHYAYGLTPHTHTRLMTQCIPITSVRLSPLGTADRRRMVLSVFLFLLSAKWRDARGVQWMAVRFIAMALRHGALIL